MTNPGRTLATLGLFASTALVACGGGGGTPTEPKPVEPKPTPPTNGVVEINADYVALLRLPLSMTFMSGQKEILTVIENSSKNVTITRKGSNADLIGSGPAAWSSSNITRFSTKDQEYEIAENGTLKYRIKLSGDMDVTRKSNETVDQTRNRWNAFSKDSSSGRTYTLVLP